MAEMDHLRMLWKSNHARPQISTVFLPDSEKKGSEYSTKSYCTENATIIWYMLTNKETYRAS
jgi:hypothetical protein